ncbi:MAG: CPBP family intramembrane metalloprotease [Bacteroidales bacterium]|jgi:membrane protease YdiL (CAAX protease family)|nr:CPBP family intramembrane metalloprotease [Bacteroidales bacterium]
MDRKKLKWLLLIALLLLATGIVVNTVIDLPAEMQDNAIMDQVSNLSGWMFFLMVVIFAPVMEELSFRSWIIDKKWAKYLSLVLISGYMALTLNIFWVIPIAALLAFNLFAMEQRPVARTYVYIVITSLCFALAHRGNLDIQHYLMAFPVYLGMGLLLCWIGLKLNFAYCFALHILYNFTLITLGGFTFAFEAPKHLEGDTFNGELTQVSGFTNKTSTPTIVVNDSIAINRSLLTDVAKLTLINSDYKIEIYPESYRFYNLHLAKKNTTPIDQNEVLQLLIKEKLIRVDTIEKTKTIRIFEK